MKKRFLGLISVATLGICLSSCNYVDIRTKKIVSISLQDSTTTYAVGQRYMDRCNLTIMATYFGSSDPVKLDKSEVSYFLTYNSNSYDVNSAFTTAGNYYLTVQKNGVNSNTIPVKVLEHEQYVTNISVTGSNEVEENKYINLTLNVTPSDFTVNITCDNDSPSLISVQKISNTSYRIKGLATGNASVTFKAKNSASTYGSYPYLIEVIPSTKTEIKQTYNDFVKHNASGISACPLEGNAKLLVIPVWFTDSSSFIGEAYKENIREDINTAYFGTESATGWESVSSFYKKESNNTLNLTGTVSEWYNSTLSSAVVATYDTNNDDGPQNNLVKAATNWYFTNHSSDSRTNYDSDGDGYIDSVMLIYGAPNYYDYTGYSGDNMWAYCYWVADSSQKSLSNPGVNVYFWASYDFMYSEQKALTRTGRSYGYGDTSHCNIDTHTYIHEMGHVFGLDDYYDYNYVEEVGYRGSNTNPAAGFSMQDNNVGSHDPFSMMAMGWADPYIPNDSSTITINDFQSSHDIIVLSNNWNSTYNSPFDEYIILELYSNTGLNKFDCDYRYRGNYAQGPQDVGIRVWHVDARLLLTFPYKFAPTPDVKNTSGLLGAFNNTSSESVRSSYAYYYLHQKEYQTINLLQLIRNSTTKTYTDRGDLSSSDLFKAGSSFSMSTFNKQFVKGNKLDNGTDLGWSFSVNSILNNGDGTYSAEIQLLKA